METRRIIGLVVTPVLIGVLVMMGVDSEVNKVKQNITDIYNTQECRMVRMVSLLGTANVDKVVSAHTRDILYDIKINHAGESWINDSWKMYLLERAINESIEEQCTF